MNLGMGMNPLNDLLIRRASLDKIPKIISVQPCKFKKDPVQPDIIFIVTTRTVKDGAALIEHPPGNDVASKKSPRTPRIIDRQVKGQVSKVFRHKLTLIKKAWDAILL